MMFEPGERDERKSFGPLRLEGQLTQFSYCLAFATSATPAPQTTAP